MKRLNTNNQSVIQRLLAYSPRGGAWMRMFFMLIITMMLSSASVMAQEIYGIKIGYFDVTSENCADLSVFEGVTGNVSFDPATKTLTLENATITRPHSAIDNYDCDNLVIKVIGTCNLTSTKSAGVSIRKPTTILGENSILNISSSLVGLWAEAPLLIQDCQMKTVGTKGISATELTIYYSYIEAQGDKDNYSFRICKKLELIGCSIEQPKGAAYDPELEAVALNGKAVTDKVIIKPEHKEKYGIRIAGVEVTSANYASLSDIDAMNSGEMSYDPKTKTLTMNEVSLSAYDSDIAIENYGCENLNIKVIGYVGVSTTEAECIHLDEATTISGGTGTIYLESNENHSIFFSKSLTVDGMRLYCAEKCGITGDTGDKEVLTVRNAYVEACAISNIKSLVLDGSTIVQPEGAAFDATLKGVALNGAVVNDKVVIKPTDYCGIDVAGIMVTKANCADLSVIDGVEGKLSYNPETNTLTMQDCTISTTTSDTGLSTEEDKNLKIEIIGNNSITAKDGAIMLNGTTTISGSGTLNVMCSNNTAIYARTPSLTIEGIRLIVEGEWKGITGFDGQTEVITVRNAYVEVTGKLGSIDDIKDLVLEGCSIVQPKGAAFDAALKGVALNGKVVTEKVDIIPDKYALIINGYNVTSINCRDLSVIDGVEGKMSYNPTTNTLTMENVTLNIASLYPGIVNEECENLNIEVIGNNSITTQNICIVLDATTTISGTGTLRLKCNYSGGIYMESPLTVEGVKLYAEGLYGIAGNDGKSDDVLTIRNAYIEAIGSKGSISNFKDLVLEDCSIVQPQGAAFDATLKGVAKDGMLVIDKVIIAPDANGIESVTIDVPAHKQGIYTILGVKLTQQWENLPAGIYIVNGKKCVKR